MSEVFEEKNAFYAFSTVTGNPVGMRLSKSIVAYYQLPVQWGIPLDYPPPQSFGRQIAWLESENSDLIDKRFTPHNHTEYLGGTVTATIELNNIAWRHELTGEERETIPAGWYAFGRGIYYDLKYLSWYTSPIAGGNTALMAFMLLMGFNFLTSGNVPPARKPRKRSNGR